MGYLDILCVEGILMVFLMYRMLSFFRLNRTVYIFWHTLGTALKALLFFTCLFMPTLAGITFIAHKVYGPYLENYALVSRTLLQIYGLLEGDLDISPLVELDTLWALFIMIIFYIVFSFFLLNVFLTIVVDAYYVIQLTTAPGEQWSTMRKAKWLIPGIFVNIYQSLSSPSSPESA